MILFYVAPGIDPDELQSFEAVCDAVHSIKSHKLVSKEQMLLIAELPYKDDRLYRHLTKSLLELRKNPILSMLDVDDTKLNAAYSTLGESSNPEVINIVMLMLIHRSLHSVLYRGGGGNLWISHP